MTLSFSREIIGQYKGRFFFVTIVLFAASVLEIFSIAALLPVLNNLLENQALNEGKLFQLLSILGLDNLSMNGLLLFIIVLMTIRTALLFTSTYYATLMSVHVEKKIRTSLLHNILYASWPFHVRQKSGEISNILAVESGKAGLAVQFLARYFVFTFLSIVFFSAGLLIAWQAFVISVVLTIPLFLIANILHKKTRKRSEARVEASHKYNAEIIETLAQAKQIKSGHMEDNTLGRFSKIITEIAYLQGKDFKYQSIIASLPEALILFIVVILIAVIHTLQLSSAGDLIFFLLVMFRSQRFIGQAQNMKQKLNSTIPSYHACKEMLAASSKEQEKFTLSDQQERFAFQNIIEIEDVSFSYENNTSRALKNISLSIPKNKMVAFVGKSGSGKTTLVDLIIGLLVPNEGNIKVDTQSLHDIGLATWRSKISYVTQDPVLFNASIRDNIIRDLPHSNEDEFNNIVKRTLVHDFVQNMPDGYDTIIGDRGARLSGGQRQRIALARALLKKPDILILDEATSALDNISEKEIQESLASIKESLTIIMIAHRLSSVKNADCIYVLEAGTIHEKGTYKELTENSGLFSRLQEATQTA